MDLIQISGERCTNCGRCAAVCPTNNISMSKFGPKAEEDRCIVCGHCVAICPKTAINNSWAPLENQVNLGERPFLDPETAARFLRSRRSIRCYKENAVEREKIIQLLNIARMAPSAGNMQGVCYHVVDDAAVLCKVTAVTIDWMEEEVKAESPAGFYYAGVVSCYRKTGEDVILRGAPCLIIAATPDINARIGRDNAHFCLAYAELYAPSINLGTCWAGFFEACATSGYEPLLNLFDLPEGMLISGGLMVGYPKYTYKRLVDRNPLLVTWQ